MSCSIFSSYIQQPKQAPQQPVIADPVLERSDSTWANAFAGAALFDDGDTPGWLPQEAGPSVPTGPQVWVRMDCFMGTNGLLHGCEWTTSWV